MALKTTPLTNGQHASACQIRLTEPEKLLADGRIIHVLSQLSKRTSGGSCAWELCFTSVSTVSGIALDARLITHTSVHLAQRATLETLVNGIAQAQLQLLEACDVAAVLTDDPHPAQRMRACITLCRKPGCRLSEKAELPEGALREHLCSQAGNGLSLMMVQSSWDRDELEGYTLSMSEERRALLAGDPVYDFALTVWGPSASSVAGWLQALTCDALTPCSPASPGSYPACLRQDPWRLLTLLPSTRPSRTLLPLSELLTLCGCPAEPGEMQRMCRTSWRMRTAEAMRTAGITLPDADAPMHPDDLRYLGLQADSDLETLWHMDAEMREMLHMCVVILRKLGAFGTAVPDRQAELLLPSVGHIYEKFVRLCCYQTMYSPYVTYATNHQPARVTNVFLSTYDQGPGPRGYRLQRLSEDASEPKKQDIIREQMMADFTHYATYDGVAQDDVFWYELFSKMSSARSLRNKLTHEATPDTARQFAESFLLDRPDYPSLLRLLLGCRHITTNFPTV